MIKLNTPRGLPVNVPETLNEDPSPRFLPSQLAEIKAYFDENGYVIVAKALPAHICDKQRLLWEREIKPFDGFIYRQATAKAERHRFNDKGWVMNPILNLQSVDPSLFPEFRQHATGSLFSSASLRDVFTALLGSSPKIVQSMYFEGNSATWEHQDTYYLDSERIGEMIGSWIALEDIRPKAGRFFICPRSHHIRMEEHSAGNNIVDHHETYISSIVAEIRAKELQIRAPRLDKGDVLFWHSQTIHGSLDSQDPQTPRSSITCHAISRGRKLLQLQTRLLDMVGDDVQGVEICRPKDLAVLKNRLVFQMETRFPVLFHLAKRNVIRTMVWLKH